MMIKLFLISILLFHTLVGAPIKVLIVDGFNNHNWEASTGYLKEVLEKEADCEVEVSTVPTRSSKQWAMWNPDFSLYDVIVQNTNDINNDGAWPEDAQRGLEKYVSEGGGLYIFHSANNAFPEWEEYNMMIGLGWRKKNFGKALKIVDGQVVEIPTGDGQNTGHGKRVDITVTKLNDHPIHREMPATWLATDMEVYRYARGPAENLTVISYAKEAKAGLNFPIEWVTNYGEGRVYTATYGHYWNNDKAPPAGMLCKSYNMILPRAIAWLAGK